MVAKGTGIGGGAGANICFLNSSNTGYMRLNANKIESLSLPPVNTTLPETKINITILGETILYTKPGNNSGS